MDAEFQRDPAWNDSAAVMGPNSDGIIVS
jgi:hypothetical protein